MAENNPNEAAEALGIAAYGGDPNVDPMGLGGVGGQGFGGDPEGSGGGFITSPVSDDTNQNIKDFMDKWGIKSLSFWDAARKGVIKGRRSLEALGLTFDAKFGLISSSSLMAFLNPTPLEETAKETDDEQEARVGAQLKGLFADILDNTPNLTPTEKSALADILANEVTDAWEGTTYYGFDIMDVLNPKVKDAIKAWKTENKVPQHVTIPSIYKKSKKVKDFPKRWVKEVWGPDIDLWDKKMDKERDEVGSLSKKDNLISAYLDKNTAQTVMDKVDANQNKGNLYGNIHNVGYKGPVKGVTTPLGPGQTFTQVQANIPTSNWSAAQHAKVGPFQGMLGLKGQGLNPSSLAPVADVSFNPSTSWGNFNTNTGLHGTAGYNTQTGAYSNIGATATGNLFGGTYGASIGYNPDTGAYAKGTLNYSW
jgi:hypothetical protein